MDWNEPFYHTRFTYFTIHSNNTPPFPLWDGWMGYVRYGSSGRSVSSFSMLARTKSAYPGFRVLIRLSRSCMYFCLSVCLGGTGGVLPVPVILPIIISVKDFPYYYYLIGRARALSRFHAYIHTYTKNRAAAEAERELGKAGETGGLDTRAAQLTNPYSQTET